MTEPTPFRVARQCLSIMSDETFLSTIDYVDFSNRYVSVKSGYWRHLVVIFKNYYGTDLPRTLLRSIKLLFLDRFNSVSANKLKKFFLGLIYCSFINFKNILSYVFDCYDEINFTQNLELRKIRHYEKLAKFHYLSLQNQFESEIEEPNLLTSENETFENELNIPDDLYSQLITSDTQYIHNNQSSFDYFTENDLYDQSSAFQNTEATQEYYDVGLQLSPDEFIASVRPRCDYSKFIVMWQALNPEEKIEYQLEYEASDDKTEYLSTTIYEDINFTSTPALWNITYARRANPELVQLDERLQQQFETYGPPVDMIDVNDDHNQAYQHIDVTSYVAIPED
jgi:hypothetical protein